MQHTPSKSNGVRRPFKVQVKDQNEGGGILKVHDMEAVKYDLKGASNFKDLAFNETNGKVASN